MNANDASESRDTLLIAGGAALVVLGAGLLLAAPGVRRALLGGLSQMLPGQDGAQGIGGVIPDVERYLKLRAM
jgi:hypothetical protein